MYGILYDYLGRLKYFVVLVFELYGRRVSEVWFK